MHRLLAYLDACTVWALTPYVDCDFRCVYCNARAQGSSRPFLPPDEILPAFRRGLSEVPPQFTIVVGILGDAYPPLEATLGLTRSLVRELIREERRFHIVTKGETVCRDIDLLAPYAHRCAVHVSLCSVDDAVLARLDPGASSSAVRLAAVERLRRAGLRVEVKAAPWIPGITDAGALRRSVPREVTIEFAPLNVSSAGARMKILGRAYTQAAVDALYRQEHVGWSRLENVRWLDPGDRTHHPFAALPAAVQMSNI